MAEYLAQTKYAIGQMLYLAKTNLDYASVFAWTLILIIISIMLEYVIHTYRKRLIQSD
jgi:NitT/TauT family transport system permease protein